jgi:hypothetical protein
MPVTMGVPLEKFGENTGTGSAVAESPTHEMPCLGTAKVRAARTNALISYGACSVTRHIPSQIGTLDESSSGRARRSTAPDPPVVCLLR